MTKSAVVKEENGIAQFTAIEAEIARIIDDSETEVEIMNRLAVKLRESMRTMDARRADVEFFMETFTPAIEFKIAQEEVASLRKNLESIMINHSIGRVDVPGLRVGITTKHDYVIKDKKAFEKEAKADGNYEGWRIWDMKTIKSYASAFRKREGKNYPGIEAVAASFITATPTDK